MAQMKSNYPFMTSLSNEFISNFLIRKYGYENVVWVIVWTKNNETKRYLYERNELSEINSPDDNRPISSDRIPSVYIDFTGKNNSDKLSSDISSILNGDYSCSYDYILNSSEEATVDLDYVRFDGTQWKGIELTTWYVPFTDKKRVEGLICKINRSPSWRGVNRAHGTKKIIEAAKDLNLTFYMLCVNTKSGVSNELNEDGNAYLFPLDTGNLNLLLEGKVPNNARFDTLKNIINQL